MKLPPPHLVGFRAVGAAIAACVALAHCGSTSEVTNGSSSTGGHADIDASGHGGSTDAACTAGEILCDGTSAIECGSDKPSRDCSGIGMVCAPKLGCVTCIPSSTSCDPQTGNAMWCLPDGSSSIDFECDPLQGMACETSTDGARSKCVGSCSPSVLGRTHVGCDFRPTVTANTVWSQWFPFGLIVTGQSDDDAEVLITRGEQTVVSRTVKKGSFERIELPWVQELKGTDADPKGAVVPPHKGVLVKAGAYRLRSSRPVSVMQFSTLAAENPQGVGQGCPDPTKLDRCLSLSNDASLLLPATSLSARYALGGWHAWHADTQPPLEMGDFVTVTATRPGTRVELLAGPRTTSLAGPAMQPLLPGDSHVFDLDDGDVLQLFTDGSSSANQWAGSWIEADKPVQVLTGAPCVNIPNDTAACDHIEETATPADALGRDYLLAAPSTPNGNTRRIVRIHSIEDTTSLTFEPPSVHATVTLAAGETLDVDSKLDFEVSSAKVFGVTQYMVGRGGGALPYDGAGVGDGDPSQSVSIARSRYLEKYAFATPLGFDDIAINVIAPTGSAVRLDDAPLDPQDFSAIGSSGFSVARIALEPGKRYTLIGDQPFSAQLYGYGAFTSFMAPVGMDLRSAGMR